MNRDDEQEDRPNTRQQQLRETGGFAFSTRGFGSRDPFGGSSSVVEVPSAPQGRKNVRRCVKRITTTQKVAEPLGATRFVVGRRAALEGAMNSLRRGRRADRSPCAPFRALRPSHPKRPGSVALQRKRSLPVRGTVFHKGRRRWIGGEGIFGTAAVRRTGQVARRTGRPPPTVMPFGADPRNGSPVILAPAMRPAL
jgi:hypothetical protein